jgi:hypothetical protein
MSEQNQTNTYRVTATIEGANAKHPTYPLLEGDMLIEQPDGSFYKTAPGLGIYGFVLTEEQRASIELWENPPRVEIVGGLDAYAEHLFGKGAVESHVFEDSHEDGL